MAEIENADKVRHVGTLNLNPRRSSSIFFGKSLNCTHLRSPLRLFAPSAARSQWWLKKGKPIIGARAVAQRIRSSASLYVHLTM